MSLARKGEKVKMKERPVFSQIEDSREGIGGKGSQIIVRKGEEGNHVITDHAIRGGKAWPVKNHLAGLWPCQREG